MNKYKYFSPNWMLWYSEDHYDELMEEIKFLKEQFIKIMKEAERNDM